MNLLLATVIVVAQLSSLVYGQVTSCADLDADCAFYSGDVCKDFDLWARTNCRQYCRHCSGGGGVQTWKCVDDIADCNNYVSYCKDPSAKKWVYEHCAKTCDIEPCRPTTPSPVQPIQTTSKFVIPPLKKTSLAILLPPKKTSIVIPPKKATAAGSSCKDKLSDCAAWGQTNCVDYPDWAINSCPKFCNVCHKLQTVQTSPLVKTTADPNCNDVLKDCPSWGLANCVDYPDWAINSCPKFCGQCHKLVTTTSSLVKATTTDPNCKDKLADCPSYKQSSCLAYPKWALDNCAKFCGVCKKTVTCVDKRTDCWEFGQTTCTGSVAWSKANCPKYCNIC